MIGNIRGPGGVPAPYIGVVDLAIVSSEEIDTATRAELRRLWADAFGERFSEHDASHAYGGVHVLARDGTRLIGHASAVTRRIRFGDGPWSSVGYVEAVAVQPDRQREGIGRRIMSALRTEMSSRWPVALLSTGRATHFYELLGWERWRGPSYTQTATGLVQDTDHGGLMILRLDPAAVPDLVVRVTCEDRPGSAW
jgi:aminoglycoside 2'-N-acetyltransferase I